MLEAAARGLSRNAYAGLKLEQVASEAGYTRGALYHLFANKEELALAVVKWVEQTWTAEVGRPAADQAEPVDALLAMARGHALYCRRGVASVMTNLSVQFAGQDHPVGQAISEIFDRLVADCAGWIEAGRENGSIPPGPPPQETALAYVGALEGLVGQLAGHTPFDVELAERAVRGVLGL
ncbi:TetR/AcrR family transcriptional regulator [Streptosporangium sp. NPDC000396]|uniref:TetR/AcrR family transcriptional regulator n=1 Tax=Streptosporangium sp. NPDC000396 TaxID=3366185 RepID=UPI00368A8FFF